jgi:tetratricopeptide (TPR) repeat protein
MPSIQRTRVGYVNIKLVEARMSKGKHANGKTHRPTLPSAADYEAYDRFLDQLESDPHSVSGAGRSEDERRIIAELLCEYSLDCSDPMLAIAYALRAVRLNSACLDARMLLAIAAEGPRDELIEEIQAIVAAGEADLGSEFFAENRGQFWGIIETRPYMRARSRLADELYLAGRIGDAVRHYEEMLRLDPNDNQGVRYCLLSHYLETRDLAGAQRLFNEYKDEASAIFAWGRVLERYLAGELSETDQALQDARRENVYVEEFITGREKLPKSRPDYYSPGDVTEAIVCMDEIGNAWKKYPDAVQWLKKEHGTGNLFTKSRGGKRPQRGNYKPH